MSNFIGIDVSKASLDCAYLRDPDQKRVKRLRCQNEVSCLASLVNWAETKSDLSVQSVIEWIHDENDRLFTLTILRIEVGT